MDVEIATNIAIPVVAFGLGCALMQSQQTETAGRLLFFLGAQTGLVFYMKEILSNAHVSEGRSGVPAAFAITGLQQLVGFVVLLLWIPASRLTSSRYTPKRVTAPAEWLMVFLFSIVFAMNIAMNNYSVSLMPISVNLIIRSCFPVPTFVAQLLMNWATRDIGNGQADTRPLEIVLMLVGVACAVLVVVAKLRSGDLEDSEAKNLTLGVSVCIMSCFAGALNLVLAGTMGSKLNLNEFDTIVYTALPATVLLLIPMSMPHTIEWQGGRKMTDWDVLREVWENSPSTLWLATLSGVFALALNLAKYSIVQSLSATHAAFAGNFNKAFTILLAMILGFETAPSNAWGVIMVLACMGNIGAFTGYSVAKQWNSAVQSLLPEEEEKVKLKSEDSTRCATDLEEVLSPATDSVDE